MIAYGNVYWKHSHFSPFSSTCNMSHVSWYFDGQPQGYQFTDRQIVPLLFKSDGRTDGRRAMQYPPSATSLQRGTKMWERSCFSWTMPYIWMDCDSRHMIWTCMSKLRAKSVTADVNRPYHRFRHKMPHKTRKVVLRKEKTSPWQKLFTFIEQWKSCMQEVVSMLGFKLDIVKAFLFDQWYLLYYIHSTEKKLVPWSAVAHYTRQPASARKSSTRKMYVHTDWFSRESSDGRTDATKRIIALLCSATWSIKKRYNLKCYQIWQSQIYTIYQRNTGQHNQPLNLLLKLNWPVSATKSRPTFD